jgi:hypothetical protein
VAGCSTALKGAQMLDIAVVVLGIGFFALSIAYCYACDQF